MLSRSLYVRKSYNSIPKVFVFSVLAYLLIKKRLRYVMLFAYMCTLFLFIASMLVKKWTDFLDTQYVPDKKSVKIIVIFNICTFFYNNH